MKKIIVMMLVGCLVFSSIVCANAETKFNDLKATNWAYESVTHLVNKGIVKGYSDGSFKPNNTVTYGEFIKLCLVASTGEDVGNSKTGNWAKSYYDKALELGYFDEIGIEIEQLNKQIPRSDMALIISNIMNSVACEDKGINFNDVDKNSNYYENIQKVSSLGIIGGYPNGSFKPNNTLTRAESSEVVYRIINEDKRLDVTKVTEPTTFKEIMEISSGGRMINVEKESISLPFRNIETIQFSDKWIQVKSKVAQDFMLYADNTFIPAVGNGDGTNYFYRDGYYFYYFNPSTVSLKGKKTYMTFGIDENEKIYELQGVNLW